MEIIVHCIYVSYHIIVESSFVHVECSIYMFNIELYIDGEEKTKFLLEL